MAHCGSVLGCVGVGVLVCIHCATGCVGILLGILGVLGILHLLPFNLQGVRIGPQLRVG